MFVFLTFYLKNTMNRSIVAIFILLIFGLITGCQQTAEQPKALAVGVNNNSAFQEYWFSGKAEINAYALKQNRYGQIRTGDVVLVFVTEPFSKKKQVKLDYNAQAGDTKVDVLKMNALRKFNTGIYDYSVMTSVFTPVELEKFPNTLKQTISIQEWCGQTFTQYNLSGNNYDIKEFSYFESEGDVKRSVKKSWLEDELFNRIRINPNALPLEQPIDLIPSTLFSRFKHQVVKPEKATITAQQTGEVTLYTVQYQTLNRKLEITTDSEFPFQIKAWKEINNGNISAEAILKADVKSAYWTQNDNRFEPMREELKLMN